MCVQANADEMGGMYAVFLPTKNIISAPKLNSTQAVWCLSGHETILNTPFMHAHIDMYYQSVAC